MTIHADLPGLAKWLRARQSDLGSCRESCSESGQVAWDKYEQVASLLETGPSISWRERLLQAACIQAKDVLQRTEKHIKGLPTKYRGTHVAEDLASSAICCQTALDAER